MTSTKTPNETPGLTFEQLALRPELLAVLTELGYEEPTPIQRAAIPMLLSGRDVVGQAATGTGKTGAFALPMLQRLDVGRLQPFSTSALIIVPTRELAIQVAEATHTYGKKMDVGVLPIYGGQPISQQLRRLRHGVHVVIATPGRALDHMRRKTLKLDQVTTVVVDEADELLDLGFADDLDELLAAVPKVAQIALFSATLPPRIAALAERHLKNPHRIRIESNAKKSGNTPKISQTAYVIPRSHKEVALGRVLDLEDPSTAIVFCRTRLEVEHLTDSLTARGYSCAALHGGLDQPMRDRVIKRFKSGEVELLIATDVAARGLDVATLTHVINYDLPSNAEDYVHRIGRTGRAGREGRAISFCDAREARFLRVLENTTGVKIELARVPTVVDLKNKRLEITRAAVEEAMGSETLASFRTVAEQLSANTDPLEVAAAAIAALHAQLAPPNEQDEKDIPEMKSGSRPESGSARGARPGGSSRPDSRPERGDRGDRGDRPRGGGGQRDLGGRLFVSLGRSAGLRPADLVGAIANEAGLSREEIGAIQIAEHHAFVEVAAERVDTVIEALKKTTVRGRRIRIDRDRGPGDRPARKERTEESGPGSFESRRGPRGFEASKTFEGDEEAPPSLKSFDAPEDREAPEDSEDSVSSDEREDAVASDEREVEEVPEVAVTPPRREAPAKVEAPPRRAFDAVPVKKINAPQREASGVGGGEKSGAPRRESSGGEKSSGYKGDGKKFGRPEFGSAPRREFSGGGKKFGRPEFGSAGGGKKFGRPEFGAAGGGKKFDGPRREFGTSAGAGAKSFDGPRREFGASGGAGAGASAKKSFDGPRREFGSGSKKFGGPPSKKFGGPPKKHGAGPGKKGKP